MPKRLFNVGTNASPSFFVFAMCMLCECPPNSPAVLFFTEVQFFVPEFLLFLDLGVTCISLLSGSDLSGESPNLPRVVIYLNTDIDLCCTWGEPTERYSNIGSKMISNGF